MKPAVGSAFRASICGELQGFAYFRVFLTSHPALLRTIFPPARLQFGSQSSNTMSCDSWPRCSEQEPWSAQKDTLNPNEGMGLDVSAKCWIATGHQTPATILHLQDLKLDHSHVHPMREHFEEVFRSAGWILGYYMLPLSQLQLSCHTKPPGAVPTTMLT